MKRVLCRPTNVLCVIVAVSTVSCVSDDATGRIERHANVGVWRDAVVGITRDPWQWGTAVTLAAAIPVAFANDAGGSRSAIRNQNISSHASTGDKLMQGMMVSAGALALGEWIYGDDGSATEVLLESTILTAGIVQLIKDSHSRQRPEGSGSFASLPSGHATMAFVAATFIARRVDDQVDGWRGYLGYLSYLPAAAVSLNRVEVARHYPSDVVVGALIGSVITNLVYNAHYGSEEGRGIRRGPKVSFVTKLDGDSVGIGMTFNF
jgi:membrane-associated phospholipid phosphatase